MELFHGSNVIVQHPKILTNGFYKDFGYGYYCTNIEKQAKRWALTKKNQHIVNVYSYTSLLYCGASSPVLIPSDFNSPVTSVVSVKSFP